MDGNPGRDCWYIDTEKSSLTFSVRHALLGEIRGEFLCWGGFVRVDAHGDGAPSVHVWIDLSSLDTGSPKRNEAILATELFDVASEPALAFDAEGIDVGASGSAMLHGSLTLQSFRQTVSVSVEVNRLGRGPSEPGLVATARASIDRRALGLRRGSAVKDWLSERLVAPTIEMNAQIEAKPRGLGRFEGVVKEALPC
jgi:polyisoprenoid-binding protein YceI